MSARAYAGLPWTPFRPGRAGFFPRRSGRSDPEAARTAAAGVIGKIQAENAKMHQTDLTFPETML